MALDSSPTCMLALACHCMVILPSPARRFHFLPTRLPSVLCPVLCFRDVAAVLLASLLRDPFDERVAPRLHRPLLKLCSEARLLLIIGAPPAACPVSLRCVRCLRDGCVGLGGWPGGGRKNRPPRVTGLLWLPPRARASPRCVPVAWRRGLERGRPGLAVIVMLSRVSRCAASGFLQHLSRRSYFMMCTPGAFLKRFLHLMFVQGWHIGS